MNAPKQIFPTETDVPVVNGPAPGTSASSVPGSWQDLRDNSNIQFEEIEIPAPEEIEPGWFARGMSAVFDFLADILAPVGGLLTASWPVLQWVLPALLIAFVLYLLVRTIGSFAGRNRKTEPVLGEPDWQPDRTESLALLEDADRLAAEGRFDEATRLLLQRSVGHIAAQRPDWVEPSSTARELAALPALSDAARAAFATISERVERSLFALRSLDRTDWETARSAYASFALARVDAEGLQKVAL
jgi:hypothetical protein